MPMAAKAGMAAARQKAQRAVNQPKAKLVQCNMA